MAAREVAPTAAQYGKDAHTPFGDACGTEPRQLGLPDERFHDLRQTCATLLWSEGMQVKLVYELLGHSTPAINLDTYIESRGCSIHRASEGRYFPMVPKEPAGRCAGTLDYYWLRLWPRTSAWCCYGPR